MSHCQRSAWREPAELITVTSIYPLFFSSLCSCSKLVLASHAMRKEGTDLISHSVSEKPKRTLHFEPGMALEVELHHYFLRVKRFGAELRRRPQEMCRGTSSVHLFNHVSGKRAAIKNGI